MASLLALAASFLWGTSDFEGGRLSRNHRPIAVLGMSQIFSLIFGAILVVVTNEKPIGTGYVINGVIAGIVGYSGLALFYLALATGRMGVVSPIASLGALIPFSVALIGGERLSTIALIGCALALVGAFCASGPEASQGLPLRPVVLSVLTALCFGVALVFMARGSDSSPLYTMVMMRVTTIFITIAIAAKLNTHKEFSAKEVPSLIFVGIADFLANLFLGIATQHGLMAIVMLLGGLSPIFTAFFAYRFLHERLHKIQYFGIVSAVAGVALLSLQ